MKKPSLAAIFLTVFLDLLGFGLVLPFLAEQARDTYGASDFVGTLLASVYSLAQFVFVPVWGRLSDGVGRRPVILWSVAATFLGMAFLGWSLVAHLGLWALFAARIWSGVATANLGVASAYIADVTEPKDRAKGMGLIGVAFGLGFILGPAIGGALAHVEIGGRAGAVPCFAAAAFSLVNLAWVAFGLGESLPGDKRSSRRRSLSPLDVSAAREAFARPGILLSVMVNFVIVLSFTNLDQTFRYFNKDRFGMTALETGGVLAFIGVVAALVQGGLIRKLGGKVDETRLIQAGSFIQGVAFAGLSASPLLGRWALYTFGAVLALGNGLTQPSISAFISRRAPASEQGGTLGTNQAVASLARMLGPATGGFLYGHIGPRAPYTVAAVGMMIATFVALLLPTAPRQPEG